MYNYEKVASSSLKEAKDILHDIYEENPKHWPHGLYPEQMDGGLYLVREASTKEPVGFVGWQERIEDFKKVGYYSVGIKQAHRRNGFAKAAVRQLIQKKLANVDKVKALIMDDNMPSRGLAKDLDVEVDLEKQAMSKLLSKLGPGAGAGIGAIAGGLTGPLEAEAMGFDDSATHLTTLLNAGTGALAGLGGGMAAKALRGKNVMGLAPDAAAKLGIGTGATAAGAWPIKTGLIGMFDEAQKSRKEQSELMDTKKEVADREYETASTLSPYQVDPETGEKSIKPFYAATALGAGALGTGGVLAMVLNALRDKNKITIDQNQKGDPDVLSVDIPKDKVSDKFYTSLNRDMLFDSYSGSSKKKTPESERERMKEILEDMDNEDEKQASMEKSAWALAGRALGGLASHGSKIVGGANKYMNPLKQTSVFRGKPFRTFAKQQAAFQGGLGVADATGFSDYAGDGNWFKRYNKFLVQPVIDSARDFRGGNYLHGIGNALYAPLHLGLNATLGSAATKHALGLGSRGLAAGGQLMARGSMRTVNPATSMAQQTLGGKLKNYWNPHRVTGVATPNLTQAQALGQRMHSWGTAGARSSMARGASDVWMSPLLRGYGQALGGTGKFGGFLGNAAAAAGTASTRATRNAMMMGSTGRNILNNPAWWKPGVGTMAFGAPMAAAQLGNNSSRETRTNEWLNKEYERLGQEQQEINDYNNDYLSNPEFTSMILNLLGLQGQGYQGSGVSEYGT